MNDTEVPARLFNRELKVRIISALVLAALVLLMTWIGGYTFSLLWSVVALVVYYEFCNISGKAFPVAIRFAGFIALGLVVMAYQISAPHQAYWIAGGAFVVLLIWEAIVKRSFWACTGFAYSVLPFFAMSELRGNDLLGLIMVLILFGSVWGADIMAYFFGRIIGGPKLAPRISPKKTWSGFIGSLVGGVGLAVIVDLVAGFPVTSAFVVLVLVLAIVSQMGDLAESVLKRRFEIKDSSNLIPGHGGLLDRIDGLIPAGVFMWMMVKVTPSPRNLLRSMSMRSMTRRSLWASPQQVLRRFLFRFPERPRATRS